MTIANGEFVLQVLHAVDEPLAEGHLAPGPTALIRLSGAADHAVCKALQHHPAGWTPSLPQIGGTAWAISLLSIEVGRGVAAVRSTQKRGGQR